MLRIAMLVCLWGCVCANAGAALRVFACEPEWGALVQELGGDQVELDVATSALQDVHMIEARPSLIAKVRRADLLVCTGAELEAGWLPQLIRQSGNPGLAGGNGVFHAAEQVATLERPAQLDRAAGDVHPQGNPHVQLDPYRVLSIAEALATRLATLDGANAAKYAQRMDDFRTRWQAAIARWELRAAPLRGRNVVVQHRSWVYLLSWLGMREVGALEPKPGVPPTSGHLAALIDSSREQQAMAIISAAYQDPKSAHWLAERTQIPVVVLPFTVGADAASGDLFGLFDASIDRLLEAAQ